LINKSAELLRVSGHFESICLTADVNVTNFFSKMIYLSTKSIFIDVAILRREIKLCQRFAKKLSDKPPSDTIENDKMMGSSRKWG
jgi:hypothetical protein